jgi:hypothetical protein
VPEAPAFLVTGNLESRAKSRTTAPNARKERRPREREKLLVRGIRSRRADRALIHRSRFRVLAEGSDPDDRSSSPRQDDGGVDRRGIPRALISWKG